MRSDCTQVVLGLLTDTDGIPLSFEIHPDNTFEGKTLDKIVNKIRDKFSVRRFIFVADRGLFSFSNLEYIRKQNGEFIVGLRMGTSKNRFKKTCIIFNDLNGLVKTLRHMKHRWDKTDASSHGQEFGLSGIRKPGKIFLIKSGKSLKQKIEKWKTLLPIPTIKNISGLML